MTKRGIGFDFDWCGERVDVGNGHISGVDYVDDDQRVRRVPDYRPDTAKMAKIVDFVPKSGKEAAE